MKIIKGGVGPNIFKSSSIFTTPQFFKFTGEIRPAKKGEYFISGAIPEVYQATNDHADSEDHIAVPIEEPPKTIVVNGITYNRAC
jgi:hypothetical protein